MRWDAMRVKVPMCGEVFQANCHAIANHSTRLYHASRLDNPIIVLILTIIACYLLLLAACRIVDEMAMQATASQLVLEFDSGTEEQFTNCCYIMDETRYASSCSSAASSCSPARNPCQVFLMCLATYVGSIQALVACRAMQLTLSLVVCHKRVADPILLRFPLNHLQQGHGRSSRRSCRCSPSCLSGRRRRAFSSFNILRRRPLFTHAFLRPQLKSSVGGPVWSWGPQVK
jgi:hypothetical protein